MSTVAYEEILCRVQQLPLSEQLQLIEKLAALIHHHVPSQPKRSILELQGLGKAIWSDLDAQQYVEQERASWNG
jgi:hypothetical protein